MTRAEVEAGLAAGTLERGVTRRWAKGRGHPPTPGLLLMPDEVDAVHPPVRGREVVAWLVLDEVTRSLVAEIRWGARVVAVGRRGASRPPSASGRAGDDRGVRAAPSGGRGG